MGCYKIFIPGKPQAQGRPRFSTRGKFPVAIDPHKDKKNWFRLQAQQQIESPIDSPVIMHITFIMTIPKSTSKKRRALMLANEIKHTKKPDLDNLQKFVLDALNGVAYRDDSLIWGIAARKVYGESEGVEIQLTY